MRATVYAQAVVQENSAALMAQQRDETVGQRRQLEQERAVKARKLKEKLKRKKAELEKRQ